SLLTSRGGEAQEALSSKLLASGEQITASIVSIEEQLRGWLARIKQFLDLRKQIPAYERLANLFIFYRDWQILPVDVRSADIYDELKTQRVRIGTRDLKIASIALAHDALLLSANL